MQEFDHSNMPLLMKLIEVYEKRVRQEKEKAAQRAAAEAAKEAAKKKGPMYQQYMDG